MTKRDDLTALSLTEPEAVALAHAAELLRTVCMETNIDVSGSALERAQEKLQSALEKQEGSADQESERQAARTVQAITDAAVRAVSAQD